VSGGRKCHADHHLAKEAGLGTAIYGVRPQRALEEEKRSGDGAIAPGRSGGGSRRRSSARITLVLIGAASIQGCGDSQPQMVQRDLYENRGKCVQDWGDEKKCEPISEGRNRGYYYGPAYSWGRSGYAPGTPDADATNKVVPKGSNAVGSHRVARSGFGSTSSAHSSGS
jgi:uncharacterized protein YgiB involved in biofilm formation